MHYFADLAAPLYTSLCRQLTWHWTDTKESDMHSLCIVLCSHPAFALPDFGKPFQIESYASNATLVSILAREYVSVHKPITFPNKNITNSEKNYSFHDCNLLAIITYCKA